MHKNNTRKFLNPTKTDSVSVANVDQEILLKLDMSFPVRGIAFH